MIRLRQHLCVWALAMVLAPCNLASADDLVHARYDVRLIGAKVGEMVIASRETATQYSTRARFKTTGAFARLSNASFDISARGRLAQDKFMPQSYREITSEGRHATNVKISYKSGIATEISGQTGDGKAGVDPKKMRGALDPITVVYATLRQQPSSKACSIDTNVYDGQRHARLTLTSRKETSQGITCTGYYWRIAGYSSPSRENTKVPISVQYAQVSDQLIAQKITVHTRYGKVTLHRR